MAESYRFSRTPRSELSKPSHWTIYDNSFIDYMKDFQVVDSDNKIIETLGRITQKAVIIDLMASTRAVSDLYGFSFRGNLFAVGLEDQRSAFVRKIDDFRNISFIEGNLRKSNTWDEIKEQLGGEKAHLIMERGYGGLYFVPTQVTFQRAVMNRMWDMLEPNGGLLVLQTPPEEILRERGIAIQSWLAQLTEFGIYNKFGLLKNSKDAGLDYGILILQKNPQALILPDIMQDSSIASMPRSI